MQAWGRTRAGESDLLGTWLPGGVWVGSSVAEVMAAFWASLATMWGNHDDRVLHSRA
jgi:hypothetical protein